MLATLTLAALNVYLTGLLTVLFLFVCVVLILTVLIQRPAGGGLSGAFGSGAGSGQTAFGAKTGDALTIATIIMFAVYLVTAVGLNFAARPDLSALTPPAAVGTGVPQAPSSATPPPVTPPAAPEGAAVPPADQPSEPPADEPSEQPSADPAPAAEPPAAPEDGNG